MLEFDYVVTHPVGLYAKLADGLVNIANRFESEVYLIYQDKMVSMKSLMGVISLGVPTQGCIHFRIEGEDCHELKQAIDAFLRESSPFCVAFKDQFSYNGGSKERL